MIPPSCYDDRVAILEADSRITFKLQSMLGISSITSVDIAKLKVLIQQRRAVVRIIHKRILCLP